MLSMLKLKNARLGNAARPRTAHGSGEQEEHEGGASGSPCERHSPAAFIAHCARLAMYTATSITARSLERAVAMPRICRPATSISW